MIVYREEEALDPDVFIDVLRRSGLAARRPVDDRSRIARMLAGADLVIVAYDGDRAVGVARAVTDFAYCCYLSDLAVDRAFQGRGIGTGLIAAARAKAGPESMCLLLALPEAAPFYERIGMPRYRDAFMYPRER